MRLRPAASRWFETYVPREQAVAAARALAATGVVQMEADRRVAEPADELRLRHFVDRFHALAAAHSRDLPRAGGHSSRLHGDPVHLANLAVHRLRDWAARVDGVRGQLGGLDAEVQRWRLLAEGVQAMRRAGLEVAGVLRGGHLLVRRLYVCPPGTESMVGQAGDFRAMVAGPRHAFLVFVGLPEQQEEVKAFAEERGCEALSIPAWLPGEAQEQSAAVLRRLADSRRERTALLATLRTLRRDPEVAVARANIDTLHWYLEHAAGHLGAQAHVRLTGWTTATQVRELQRALAAIGIRAVVRAPNPPDNVVAPVAQADNWWTQPFRPLVSLWGTPGAGEVDPTGLLAAVVPMMFGYMFPDVGHGLLLAVLAAAGRRRWPQIGFLVRCGVAAAAFGLLFGEVFGLHGVLPPLWLSPFDDPLSVLLLPLLFGAALLLLGMLFAGVEAYWRGELRRWLLVDGAVLLAYVTALLGIFWQPALWLTGAALLQSLVAAVVLSPPGRRLTAFPAVLGDLLLSAFELVMNTFSFLRVGAFALAHSALALAIGELAGAVEAFWAKALIFVLGNLLAMLVEGLLVFVQTTRLVLFEFFLRFLRAEGRLFRPLARAPGDAKVDG